MPDDVASTPIGLLKCLQFLAAEAAGLSLHQTLSTIRNAIETCRREAASSTACATAPERLIRVH